MLDISMIITITKTIFRKEILRKTSKTLLWFFIGTALGLFLFASFALIIFQKINSNMVYPGVMVDDIYLGGKREEEIVKIFEEKNTKIAKTLFTFSSEKRIATVSASELDFGYDPNLIAKQAISIGRTENYLSNISLIMLAYANGLELKPAFHYSQNKLDKLLSPFIEDIDKEAIDAQFAFEEGRVTTFKASSEGQKVDVQEIEDKLFSQFEKVTSESPKKITIAIPIKVIKPKVTTDSVNTLGIKELIGSGTSFFAHSIPSRIFNIKLAASRINGVLVAPDETFSFNKALGDVSSFTGYKQAYIIENGKTVLGDGGGVCQVSTTFFRSILNAGLPIVERHAHAYRVSYYEQDSPAGLDATIYVPAVDLKFKNDTKNYILVQTQIDEDLSKLSIFLYGTSDGRSVEITKPVITSRVPAPQDVYQDDPTLPKGEVKQIDFKAEGARVSFTRKVTLDGKEIIFDKFVSNYSPWKSVFLRGTKE